MNDDVSIKIVETAQAKKLVVNDMAASFNTCFLLSWSCTPVSIVVFWVRQFVPDARKPASVRKNWRNGLTFRPFLLAVLNAEKNLLQWIRS